MMKTQITAIALTALLCSTGALAQADAARGEKLFEECAACHTLARNAEGVGPSLHGVFGRKAGGSESFRYSPAMKRAGITWTAQTVDAYLADPQRMIPANRMPYAGMPEARDRADVILYMQQAFK
jgi:cytochrome c